MDGRQVKRRLTFVFWSGGPESSGLSIVPRESLAALPCLCHIPPAIIGDNVAWVQGDAVLYTVCWLVPILRKLTRPSRSSVPPTLELVASASASGSGKPGSLPMLMY